MDEDGGKQVEDSRRRGREHVEENCEVLGDVGERTEATKKSEETLEVVELAEVEVRRRTDG